MNIGAVIFAHNSRKVDYSIMAMIAAGLVKKNLSIPVSMITDRSTVEWMEESGTYNRSQEIFDKIILTERPTAENYRNLNDGNQQDNVPFVNANRYSAWNLTPYDRTLLIDSDFLIFSNRLKPYLNSTDDLMISRAMSDLGENRVGTLDRYVSDTGPNLFWATNVIFNKNENTKVFFDLVDYIRENYSYYADLFRFYPKPYRNDISFSIALHILNGFNTRFESTLPPILTTIDKDILQNIDESKLIFLINQGSLDDFVAASSQGQDVHIMNKQSIIRNKESLLKLI
jgi:hypothetical protein